MTRNVWLITVNNSFCDYWKSIVMNYNSVSLNNSHITVLAKLIVLCNREGHYWCLIVIAILAVTDITAVFIVTFSLTGSQYTYLQWFKMVILQLGSIIYNEHYRETLSKKKSHDLEMKCDHLLISQLNSLTSILSWIKSYVLLPNYIN